MSAQRFRGLLAAACQLLTASFGASSESLLGGAFCWLGIEGTSSASSSSSYATHLQDIMISFKNIYNIIYIIYNYII